MSAGLLFCFLGALSFGLLGAVAKVAERRKCEASAVVVSVFIWATLFMLGRTISLGSGFALPVKAIAVAVVCGICASVSALAFQMSMKMGKVTVGWLMMNLSTGLPAVISIWLYHESLSPLKLAAMALALIALLLLFRGYSIEARETDKAQGEGGVNVVSADARRPAH